MCYVTARFCFALRMEDNVRSCGSVHVFDHTPLVPLLGKFTSCYCGRGWSCADVFFSIVFWWVCTTCLLCFCCGVVFSRTISFRLNLYFTDLGLTKCSSCLEHWYIYIYCLRSMVCIMDYSGQGAAGLCVVVDGLMSQCNFHFQQGWMLPHNWVMFWPSCYYESECPVRGALCIKVSNIVLGLTVSLSLIWLLDFVCL